MLLLRAPSLPAAGLAFFVSDWRMSPAISTVTLTGATVVDSGRTPFASLWEASLGEEQIQEHHKTSRTHFSTMMQILAGIQSLTGRVRLHFGDGEEHGTQRKADENAHLETAGVRGL